MEKYMWEVLNKDLSEIEDIIACIKSMYGAEILIEEISTQGFKLSTNDLKYAYSFGMLMANIDYKKYQKCIYGKS